MNTKISTIISFLVVAAIVGFSAYLNFSKSQTGKISVQTIKNGKESYVKGMRPQYKQSDPSKWSPETRKRVEEYERDIKAQDEANNLLSLGVDLSQKGKFDEAIIAYKKGYGIWRGTRTLIGYSYLIPLYERLHRYDEALTLLDEMEKEFELSEKGKQDFAATRTRLQTAKEKSQQ